MWNLTVGLVQRTCSESRDVNIATCIEGIRAASALGAKLVVLPELHNGAYFPQNEDTSHFDLAEPIPGPSTDLYASAAKEFGVVLVTSLFERRGAEIGRAHV